MKIKSLIILIAGTGILILAYAVVGEHSALAEVEQSKDETTGKFVYSQKPIRKVKEKSVKLRVAVSRFEDKIDIEDSLFNIPEETQGLAKTKDDTKDIDITIKTDEQKDEDKTIPKRELLTGLLTDSLRDTDLFDVVERSEVNQLIREINFQNSKWSEEQSLNTLGNIYGVQYVITGDVLRNRYGDKVGQEPYTLALRMYSVNTGDTVSSSVKSSSYIKNAVVKAVKDIASQVQSKPWTCRVVGVSDEGVYINAGLKDSLEEDEVFYVYRLGNKITDPETGEILGADKKKIALVEIEKVLGDNLSRAKALEDYAKIIIGDIVFAKRIDKGKKSELERWREIKGKTSEEISEDDLDKYSIGPYTPEDIMANLGNSVVKIESENGMGSGFVVSSDGYIVTNFHVIQNSEFANVKMIENNKYITGVPIVKVNPTRDLALLKADAVDGLPSVTLGDSDNISVGEQVVAIGNPKGFENTISDGLISGIRESSGVKFIQTSVPVTHGSSGGPLVNMRGEVIGVISAGLQKEGNINFAVPINYVKDEML